MSRPTRLSFASDSSAPRKNENDSRQLASSPKSFAPPAACTADAISDASSRGTSAAGAPRVRPKAFSSSTHCGRAAGCHTITSDVAPEHRDASPGELLAPLVDVDDGMAGGQFAPKRSEFHD